MAYLASEMADANVYERLVYVDYVGKDTEQIPVVNTMTTSDNYSAFLSYDSTTGKFTVLQDFDAVIVPWVYSYRSASSSRSEGKFFINNTEQVWFGCNAMTAGSKAGYSFAYHFLANDTFYSYTPSGNGYPQQMLKVYRSLLPIDNLSDIMFYNSNA